METLDQEQLITLRSKDNREFKIPPSVAFESEILKNQIQDLKEYDMIPIPNVKGDTLEKVIEFCTFQTDLANDTSNDSAKNEKQKEFNQKFLRIDQEQLFDLILAANFLNIQKLLQLTCQEVADMIKGKCAQDIRRQFNIVNDFTPEEEEEVRRENQWAFD